MNFLHLSMLFILIYVTSTKQRYRLTYCLMKNLVIWERNVFRLINSGRIVFVTREIKPGAEIVFLIGITNGLCKKTLDVF